MQKSNLNIKLEWFLWSNNNNMIKFNSTDCNVLMLVCVWIFEYLQVQGHKNILFSLLQKTVKWIVEWYGTLV